MFQKYDVDLVLYSHNQYYERTYPILYNENEELVNDKSDIPNPIVAINDMHEYPPTDGIVFLSVGTAGDKWIQLEKHTTTTYFSKVNTAF